MTPCAGIAGKEKQVHNLLPLTMYNHLGKVNVDLTCSPHWHPVEIRLAECYEVTRRKRAFQFVLTTKLTTERLDVFGRRWTIR